MDTYKPRIADSVLARKLAGKGAVLIEGPKWCGKTTTAEQQAKSVIYMDDPKKVKENLLKADLAPQELLEGDHPRLLDEWQIAPQLWDTIRFDVDHRTGNGHYILTGSSVPVEEEEDEEQQEENKKMRHSGTGRYGWVKMRPMALYESGESNGSISLKELFNAPEKIYAKSNLSREELAFVLCRGGWPAAIDLERDIALDQAFDYVDSVAKKDMNRVVDKVRRNPERVRQLMRSYARNVASQAPYETIAADMQPATCWTCKGPDVPRMMRELSSSKSVFDPANFYAKKWSELGAEEVNTIGCSDCHDARTMDLRPARPALYEAFARRGLNVKDVTHQEMRSLVCAQCHVEYYFIKPNDEKNPGKANYLVFPHDKGLTCEAAEEYYDSIGFYDYIHPLSKTKILKAQHPGWEMSQHGIHAQRGVSCADCHMPYKQEGGLKFSDHQIQSPLAKIDRTCQTCHRQDAEVLRQNVYDRQEKCNEVRNRAEQELARAHFEAKFIIDKGATEAEMAPIQALLRKSQWRWDYAIASHGATFHAPQEVTRLLSASVDYAQQARLLIARVAAKQGYTDVIPVPDYSTKAKAQAAIGLDMKTLNENKQRFLKEIEPKWIEEAKKTGKLIEL